MFPGKHLPWVYRACPVPEIAATGTQAKSFARHAIHARLSPHEVRHSDIKTLNSTTVGLAEARAKKSSKVWSRTSEGQPWSAPSAWTQAQALPQTSPCSWRRPRCNCVCAPGHQGSPSSFAHTARWPSVRYPMHTLVKRQRLVEGPLSLLASLRESCPQGLRLPLPIDGMAHPLAASIETVVGTPLRMRFNVVGILPDDPLSLPSSPLLSDSSKAWPSL
jgi:hypothetical protein